MPVCENPGDLMTNDGTTAGPCNDETEVVAPVTEAAPDLAWSHEEPATEMLARPWRSAWVIAGVGVACAVVIALVVVGVGMAVHHDREPVHPQAGPAPTQAAPAKPSDDSEYVATAISPRALQRKSLHGGGFGAGAGGTQQEADNVALAECRGNPDYADNCVLVNGGMYHGCISVAVDTDWQTWNVGTGDDAATSESEALRRLAVPGHVVSVQCSDPPGWLTSPPPAPPSSVPQAVAPLPPPAPSTVTVQAAPPSAPAAAPRPRDADRIFREGVSGIPDMHIVNWDVAEAGARSICGGFAKGMTRAQVVDEVQRNDPTFLPWQTSGMVNVALAAYCPQYEGN